jgi:hypothetical protein
MNNVESITFLWFQFLFRFYFVKILRGKIKNAKRRNIAIVICIARLENAILQVQARFVHKRETCKTFSSRVIHKNFSADDLFQAKYNNSC